MTNIELIDRLCTVIEEQSVIIREQAFFIEEQLTIDKEIKENLALKRKPVEGKLEALGLRGSIVAQKGEGYE